MENNDEVSYEPEITDKKMYPYGLYTGRGVLIIVSKMKITLTHICQTIQEDPAIHGNGKPFVATRETWEILKLDVLKEHNYFKSLENMQLDQSIASIFKRRLREFLENVSLSLIELEATTPEIERARRMKFYRLRIGEVEIQLAHSRNQLKLLTTPEKIEREISRLKNLETILLHDLRLLSEELAREQLSSDAAAIKG